MTYKDCTYNNIAIMLVYLAQSTSENSNFFEGLYLKKNYMKNFDIKNKEYEL